ncbi:MAG: ABC-F family ATP-binding cassette domain-containing protein [Candidatus Paceibacterota bacterium]|jgi:ATPase subunit of ABC transporter with duplicated ATPase domains
MENQLISCTHIGFSFGEHKILRDVSFSMQRGEVVALVGPNGVGKSTLLKIIAGKINQSKGAITLSKNIRVAYQEQEMTDEERKLTVSDCLSKTAIKDFSKLNLAPEIMIKKIGDLSGGEKSKINLLKLLGAPFDLYILDEPTNNLDSSALEFLEGFIRKRKKDSAFIIVSHDRQLLENMADKIVEIDANSRKGSIYPGPFSLYMSLRKQKIENEWKRYNDYLEEKRQLERSLRDKKQWSARAEKGPKKTDNEKVARGNQKDWSGKTLGKAVKLAREKIDMLERVDKPKEMPIITYDIPVRERSGDMVFEIRGITKTIGTKNIGPIDLNISFGDKVAIIGDNGAGKTTLLKMIIGDVTYDKGEIKKGARVDIGYIPQESELGDDTVIRRIKESHSQDETGFRAILNNLGITKEEIKKSGNELSPGERSRFILASIIAQQPNCLIMDEPTNHLDIYALDFLEEAINHFEGTVIVVTHDRYFLNRMGEHKTYMM